MRLSRLLANHRKIMAIVRAGSSRHGDFIAVVKVRDAAQRQRQRKSQFQLCGSGSGSLAIASHRDSRKNVISELGCGYSESWRNTSAIFPAGAPCSKTSRSGKVQRVIEKSGGPRIDSVEALPAGKEGSDVGIGMKNFADGGQVGINPAEAAVPVGPEFTRYIGERVEAISVQSGCFRPPDTVLQKILRDQGIFRVQIGQHAEEPAFGEIFGQTRRCVWINQSLEGIVTGLLPGFSVEGFVQWTRRVPVLCRRAMKPVR